MGPGLSGPLVSADSVAAMLGDPTLRIVHVSVDRETYPLRHVSGAVFSDLHADLARAGTSPDTGTVPRTYMTPTRGDVEVALARWGVGEGDRVVLYDDVGQNRYAIRGYWLLLHHGYPADRIHVLDGGLDAWTRLALPAAPDVAPPANPTPAVLGPDDDSILAEAEQVVEWSLEALGDGEPTRILDVRTIDEYLGRDVRALRGGRIPGALQRLWTDFLAPDGTIRPAGDCLAVVRACGVKPDEVRAVYCQGGVRAALVWFVLHELAGLEEVRNYAGSWEEWGNRPDLPIEA